MRQARDGETCAVVEFHETALLLAAALPIARRPAAYGNRRDALMMVFGDRGYSTVGQMPGIEMALGPLNTLHHLLCLPSSLAHLLRAAGPDILALVGAEMR